LGNRNGYLTFYPKCNNLGKRYMKRDIYNINKAEKKEVYCGSVKGAEINEHEYWQMVLYDKKFEMITYLRECFYGKKATTGRIQRLHKTT
jgi:hypothetical protein